MSDTPDHDLPRRAEAARLRSLTTNAVMSDPPDPDLLRRMEAAILKMPKKQRNIFLAHRVHGMSYREIADRTGLSVRRVQHHMGRAIYKLAKQMDGRELTWWERRF